MIHGGGFFLSKWGGAGKREVPASDPLSFCVSVGASAVATAA